MGDGRTRARREQRRDRDIERDKGRGGLFFITDNGWNLIISVYVLRLFPGLKLLCDPDNVPAMLNCAHGKDRTGIVSALVLVCFGKSKEFISLDYARSEV